MTTGGTRLGGARLAVGSGLLDMVFSLVLAPQHAAAQAINAAAMAA
jgi:hypothetical protein